MKINSFWGELTDNSAKKEALIIGCFGTQVASPCQIQHAEAAQNKKCMHISFCVLSVNIAACIHSRRLSPIWCSAVPAFFLRTTT